MADNPTPKTKAERTSGVTRFHRMAAREGGLSRAEAIQRSEAFLEAARPRYHEWVAEDLSRLETALALVRAAAPPRRDTIDGAYHCARSIRDLGATMGYPDVTAVADSLCELLYRFQAHGLYGQEAVDTHFSSLLLVSSSNYEDVRRVASESLLPGLKRVVALYPPVGPANRPTKGD